MELTGYGIHQKFEELFRKHMNIPEGAPSEKFSLHVSHNLEYAKWRILPDGSVQFWQQGYDFDVLPEPLDIFYGQHENMRRVEQGFRDWVAVLQHHAIARIYDAMIQLHAMQVEIEHVQVPRVWSLILPARVLGIKVEIGEPPRLFSEAKYGRFIEFEL